MSYIKNFFILLILLLSASSISFGDNVIEEKSFVNLKNLYLDESKFIQNDNIKLVSLNIVDEAHEVPVVVKLPSTLKNAKQIVILIDENPIQLASKVYLYDNVKSIGLNIRLEQDSIIRAAVLDQKNVWNVNSRKIIVNSPGGCSLPACNPEKEICEKRETGIIKLKKYKRTSGSWRYKISINHPMDTGLVTDSKTGKLISEYFINKVLFRNNKGIKLAEAETYGALSANPIIIIDFYQDSNLTNIIANDTKGNTFKLDKNL